MNEAEMFETNRNTWNAKVPVHADSEFYDLANFRKGKSSLNKYEMEAFGEVCGQNILHLQCHFGQDTLSLARMGAKCTGVDISDEAIKLAKQLNTELKLDAKLKKREYRLKQRKTHFCCC